MQIEKFYSVDGDTITFSRAQASAFAKGVADDFNPLHDPEAKLFCVPGDLLFAVALARYGVSRQMRVHFAGMVDGGVALHFPPNQGDELVIRDGAGRDYLRLERSGERSQQRELIESLTSSYVTFSGHTFPDILVPLMAEYGVMINPDRPLVIYQRMEIALERLDSAPVALEYRGATFENSGKKGSVSLNFDLTGATETLGRGAKYMLVRGLKPYDRAAMEDVVARYHGLKERFREEA